METNKEHIRALLFEKIAGTISDADNRVLEAAIAQDETVAEMWEDVQREMNSAGGRAFMANMNEDRTWEAVKSRLKAPARKARAVSIRWSAAAAVLIAIAAGGAYFLSQKRAAPAITQLEAPQALQLKLSDGTNVALTPHEKDTIAAGAVQLVTAGNKLSYAAQEGSKNDWGTLEVPARLDYKIALKDGTEVWLNSVSSLRFPYFFEGDKREVYLTGEAYFKVAPDPQRPFIVHAGPNSVQVLGTSFNLNVYNAEEMITSLVDGAVISRAGDLNVQLKPGEQAVYSNGRFTTGQFDQHTALSWMNGVSNFRNTTLQQIAAIITRWYNVKVVFDDPQTGQIKISGAIDKHKPLEVFLTNISLSSGVSSHLENGVLHLK